MYNYKPHLLFTQNIYCTFRLTDRKQRTNPLRYRIICSLLMDADVQTEYINKCTFVHFIDLFTVHCRADLRHKHIRWFLVICPVLLSSNFHQILDTQLPILKNESPMILVTALHSVAAALSSVLLKTNWCNQSAITLPSQLIRRGRRVELRLNRSGSGTDSPELCVRVWRVSLKSVELITRKGPAPTLQFKSDQTLYFRPYSSTIHKESWRGQVFLWMHHWPSR